MTALFCPLCSQSRFDNLDSLRKRLVQAATQNITCPICSEVLLGLDKFTIHLFGHSIPEVTKTAEPPPQCTVNMDDLSFLTSWENCWKQTQESQKVESQPKQVINELFLEIKSEESYPRDKQPSSTSELSPILQQLGSPLNEKQPTSQFKEIRKKTSPPLDSPTFLFEGENSFILSPSPKPEDNDSSQETRNNMDVRQLSQYMAGLLRLETIPVVQQNVLTNPSSMVQREQNNASFIKQNMSIVQAKQPWEQCIPSTSQKKVPAQTCTVRSKSEKILQPEISSLTPQFLILSESRRNECIPQSTKTEKTTKPDDAKHEAYFCKECGKSFRMRGSLVVHTRVAHSGKIHEISPEPRNFHCGICSKAFKKEQHLAQHIKTHDGKQWQCETCSKFFTTKYFLKKHQRLHTGEMPYCCESCGKTFTFQQSYHKHLLYHSADKPHECRECGRSFKELSTLHNHQRIHSGEKPFACETCGKCFRQRVSYIVHQRIHTGVLPYQCTACFKKFRYKVSQRSHKCTAQPPGIVVRQPGDLIQRLLEQRRILQCPQ